MWLPLRLSAFFATLRLVGSARENGRLKRRGAEGAELRRGKEKRGTCGRKGTAFWNGQDIPAIRHMVPFRARARARSRMEVTHKSRQSRMRRNADNRDARHARETDNDNAVLLMTSGPYELRSLPGPITALEVRWTQQRLKRATRQKAIISLAYVSLCASGATVAAFSSEFIRGSPALAWTSAWSLIFI